MKKLVCGALCLVLGVAQAETTGGYLKENLVAFWDAYENAGVGQHDANATTWKNLSGNGLDWTINLSAASWKHHSLSLAGTGDVGTLAQTPEEAFGESKLKTVELVYANAENRNGILFLPGFNRIDGANFDPARIAEFYTDANGCLAVTERAGVPMQLGEVVTYSVRYQLHATYGEPNKFLSVHTNGVAATTSYVPNMYYDWTHGKVRLGSQGRIPYAKGELMAIRVYDRDLTDAEREANRALDVIRFEKGDVYGAGVYSEGYPQNYAADNLPAYGAVDHAIGETVTLTAPVEVQLTETEKAVCTGWKLYDRPDGNLIAASDDETRLVCKFTYGAPVRLVWQWEIRHAIFATAAQGLTVEPSVCWVLGDEPATFTVEGTDCPLWSGVGIDDRFTKTVTIRSAEPTTVTVSGGTAIAVPVDVDTIELALAAAQPGDVVTLAPGVYTNASVDGIVVPLNVTLKGMGDDPSKTTVSTPAGTGSASLVTVTGGRLENITFTGARCNSDTSVPRVLSASDGAVVTNCVFTGHTTSVKGNLVLITGEGTRVVDTTISESSFSGGNNWTGGHAVRILDKAVVSDAVIDNVDMRVGTTSAAVVLSGGAQLIRSTVRKCDVYTMENFLGRAGGVCIDSSGAGCLIDGCVIEENSITTDQSASKKYQGAGGLAVNAAATVRNTVIRNNKSANAYCGGVWLPAAATLENCLIAGNKVTAPVNAAQSVAGIYASSASAVLKHVTVVGNELASVGTSTKAHGAYLNGAQAVNSIFWGNGPAATAANSLNLAVAGAKGCVTCSLVSSEAEWLNASNAKSGEGCVTGDPLFTDAATGDYTVGSLSPAVDSGDPETGVAEDLRGIARPKNFGFDMGCYECEYTATYECSIAPILQYVGAKGGTVRFTGNATMAKAVERMVWTVTAASGDAPAGGEGLMCDITFPAGANVYTVSLTTYWNDGHEAPAAESATVRVTGGVALNPGDDLVAMLAQMQGLSADNPVTVSLAEGLYTAENSGVRTDNGWMFAVPAGVVLQGAGEGRTVLDGGAARCVLQVFTDGIAADLTVTNALSAGTAASGYFVDVPGGTIRNITVDGCKAKCSSRSGQHAVCVSLGGFMTDCTVKDIWNTPPDTYQSYGAILLVSSGTVSNSTVVGNKSVDKSYGNISLFGANVLMTDCLVCSNYAHNVEWRGPGAGGVALSGGAVLRNSRICDNTADRCCGYNYAGGINASGSTVENCVVIGNKANYRAGDGTHAAGVLLGSSTVVRNCLIADNVLTTDSATSGDVVAGVRMIDNVSDGKHFNGTLLNCTLVGNTIKGNARPRAGLVLEGGTVRNVIIWDNVGITNGVTVVANTAATTNGWRTVSCTCTTPLIDGEGNIDEDPRLSVRKVRYGQIKSSSPCVNAGDPTGWTADDVDLLGNPRLRKGATIDMGCYQATLQGLMLLVK